MASVQRGSQKISEIGFGTGSGYKTTIMGHSSGGHIAVSWALRGMLDVAGGGEFGGLDLDCVVGLSGVYDVGDHWWYEHGRGVEELSPMGGAFGGTYEGCVEGSVEDFLYRYIGARTTNGDTDPVFGLSRKKGVRFLLLTGVEDKVVPFTNTAIMARIMKGLFGDENVAQHFFGKGCRHDTTVTDIMTEGRFDVGGVVHRFVTGKGKGNGMSKSKL